VLHADQQIRIRYEGEIFQRFVQVARTYLAGSAGAVYGLGEAQPVFFRHLPVLCKKRVLKVFGEADYPLKSGFCQLGRCS